MKTCLSVPQPAFWDLGKITRLVSLPTHFSLNPSPRSFPDVPPPHSHVLLTWYGPVQNSPFLSILGRSDCLHYLNIHPRNTRLLWLRHWSHCLHFQKEKKKATVHVFSRSECSLLSNIYSVEVGWWGESGFPETSLDNMFSMSTLHQSKTWTGFSLGPSQSSVL